MTIVTGAITRTKSMTGIYFLIDKNRIVYVGRSTNFLSRFCDHDVGPKVWDRYYFLECKPEDLSDVESLYIGQFRPKYNKTRLFNDPSGVRSTYRPGPRSDGNLVK